MLSRLLRLPRRCSIGTASEGGFQVAKWIVGAALASLVALVEIPALGKLFGLGEIASADWLLVIVLAAVSVSWFEIYKLAKRLLKNQVVS